MKYFSIFTAIIILSSCFQNQNNNKRTEPQYFQEGQLSKNYFVDSVARAQFSNLLSDLNEYPLTGLSENISTLRLIVQPTFYNSYCIRLDKSDSLSTITLKISDKKWKNFKSGLKKLELCYESDHRKLDSLSTGIFAAAKVYDFINGLDDAGFVQADGISYLLEYNHNGVYKVVEGCDGGEYGGKTELMSIVGMMHDLIPSTILPDLKNARVVNDILFPTLK